MKQIASFLDGVVHTHGNLALPIKAETLCLHSDTEGAALLAKEIHQFLEEHEIRITSD